MGKNMEGVFQLGAISAYTKLREAAISLLRQDLFAFLSEPAPVCVLSASGNDLDQNYSGNEAAYMGPVSDPADVLQSVVVEQLCPRGAQHLHAKPKEKNAPS